MVGAPGPDRPRRVGDLGLARARPGALGDRGLGERRRPRLRPGSDAPRHRAGDSFTLRFDQPGVYEFRCKLHASVRGEVIVSSTPGEHGSDPGPRPPINIDAKRPTLGSVRLARRATRGHRGIPFSAQISERGTLDIEYHRFNSKGQRRYNGYRVFKTFIGIDNLTLGARWKRFRARPGRYLAVLRATDQANNVSRPVRKRFRILAGGRNGRGGS